MKDLHTPKNDLYYTHDHEWVNFLGSVAYVGVCAFKLTGIRQIRQVEFECLRDFKKAGDMLATIFSGECKIPVHMPVDGEVLGYNEALLDDNRDILLRQPEKNGWIVFIVPSSISERSGLLLPEQYMNRNKRNFVNP
jgi:glycine cleavage system H protein